MLVITGATGKLGSLIVERLLTLLPANQLGASVRNTSADKAVAFAKKGVRVRAGDFNDPNSLAHAFENTDRLLIISVDKFGEEAVIAHRNAIEAAKKAGAKKIYYTSHLAARENSSFPAAEQHWITEQDMKNSGLDWVSFRNGFYLESLMHMIGGVDKTGKIALPNDGKVSWTATSDLAEGIAKFLAEDQSAPGNLVNLTNSSSWDFDDIANILSSILDKKVERIVTPEDQYISQLVNYGAPEVMAKAFAGAFRAFAAGDSSGTDGELESLLGRKAMGMEEFLKGKFGSVGR